MYNKSIGLETNILKNDHKIDFFIKSLLFIHDYNYSCNYNIIYKLINFIKLEYIFIITLEAALKNWLHYKFLCRTFLCLQIYTYFWKKKKKSTVHLRSTSGDRILVGCRETCRSGTMNNFTYKSDSWLYSKNFERKRRKVGGRPEVGERRKLREEHYAGSASIADAFFASIPVLPGKVFERVGESNSGGGT